MNSKSSDKYESLASSHLVQKSSSAADKTQTTFFTVPGDLYWYITAELEIYVIACFLTHSSSMIIFDTS